MRPISRREVLVLSGAIATYSPGSGLAASGDSNEPYSDPTITDAWIRQWMQSPQAAGNPLHLGRFADPMYFLREPISWSPNLGQKYTAVNVPIGFVTDFASIPRIFWIALPKDGRYTYASIVHDYLYWDQTRSKEEADDILRMSMEDFRVDSATITAIYQGVHLGGGPSWRDNAALKKAGEKRVLKKYPTSATTTWTEWKAQPDVIL